MEFESLLSFLTLTTWKRKVEDTNTELHIDDDEGHGTHTE